MISKANDYLFRNPTEGILYFIVYLGLPMYTIFWGEMVGEISLVLALLSSDFGLFYDCCTRYDKNCPEKKKEKLYRLGTVCLLSTVVAFIDIQYYIVNKRLFSITFLLYLSFIGEMLFASGELYQVIELDIKMDKLLSI